MSCRLFLFVEVRLASVVAGETPVGGVRKMVARSILLVLVMGCHVIVCVLLCVFLCLIVFLCVSVFNCVFLCLIVCFCVFLCLIVCFCV